jgi:chemotaxis protein methyltransferase CheR
MEIPATMTNPDRNSHEISPDTFDIIGKILKNRTGFSLDSYKDKCIKRRISIRIRATHSPTAEDYSNLLLNNDAELDNLLKVLTIHVSHFFRNPTTFDKLRTEILPILFRQAQTEGRDSLTILSVGCASGEEPYSLALILREYFAEQLSQVQVRIHAIDVDAATLVNARNAVYTEDRLAEVSEELRTRYFDCRDNKFYLHQSVKEMVTFEQRDLYETGSFADFNLALCRNVLIYFERTVQEKILSGLAAALHSGGFLVLGKSETMVGESRKLFKTICPVERIYQVL